MEMIEDKKMRNPTVPFSWNLWRLDTTGARQVWHFRPPAGVAADDPAMLETMARDFAFDRKKNPNSGDKVFRSAATALHLKLSGPEEKAPGTIAEAARDATVKGFNFYNALQSETGHWPGDYGGPHFLTPGLIIASYITKTEFPRAHQALMKQYMLNHQNEDGGWGLHIEDTSTMFGTVLQYVSLRLLGAEKHEPAMERARKWIIAHGGATAIPSWGKFYLSLLGVYEWEGTHSLFPEMWILPKSLPIHAWRYWCHCRMVYLPMSYCYGHKITGEITPLVLELREELYDEPYDSIRWKKARNKCAAPDQLYPTSGTFKFFSFFLNAYEKVHVKKWRKRASDFILEYMGAEDKQTNFIDIGPVNQVINSVGMWHAYGKDSEQFRKHTERWYDYLWVAEDGMKMNGYNGSQFWDTAFATQALLDGEMEKVYPETLRKAYSFFDLAQVKRNEENRERYFRSVSKGGWPFSTADHGWPITDCTSEGIKATILANRTGLVGDPQNPLIGYERLKDGADILISYQNKDGGWASYEKTRGPSWLELLNPAEIFGEIMVDYSYVECSSACIQGLQKFHSEYPEYRAEEIASTIRRGTEFIRNKQREDGSWYGSWAVCFTYGTWFGIEGLVAGGSATYKSGNAAPELRKACEFLASIQREDGSWGESYASCVTKKYVPHAEGQVINTAWALLGLMAAGYPEKEVIEKGIRFLLEKQTAEGDWEQEGISGVFNHNCMITYTSYRNVFPLWALGRFAKLNRKK